MKKSLLMAVAPLLATIVTGSMVSCRSDNTIEIQFVPSRDSEDLTKLGNALTPILEKYSDGLKYHISTGSSYGAVTEALISDQIDFGFLTASALAQCYAENDPIDVLLTSVRDGYQVQVDVGNKVQNETIRKQQVDAMNGANGYSYLGQQTSGEENQVTFYNSICFVLNDEERAKLGKEPLDANGDGTVTIDELAGKDVIRQGQTSGAGYLYPSFFLSNLKNQANRDIWMSKDYASIITDTKTLNEKGMTFVEGNADASKGQIHGVNTDGGYDAAFNQVMSGGADAAFGFMDIRYTQGYSKSTSDYYQDKDLFKKTQTVCMTTPIYNDTISYRTNLDAKTVETVKNAFISASKDGSKDEEGTGAYLLYKIYSHTGYKTASKEDYADEVEMYKWKVANGI